MRSGQPRIGGRCRIGLDDDFPIRKALLAGARFSIENIAYYNKFYPFLCMAPERWKWVDGFG